MNGKMKLDINCEDTPIFNEMTPNREYKDSVFVDLHSKDELLREDAVIDIYNALHDKKITRKEQIKFIKLENVFFHKVRNDVSFTVDGKVLILLEHQSTINENMPYRCLEYSLAIISSQMKRRDKFLPSPIKILSPEFYVIYNGDASYPAIKEQCLSDLFAEKTDDPRLELIVTVININHPDNKNFLDSCPLLRGYKKLVDKVKIYKRLYGDKGYVMAIEECIREGIEIQDYLKRKTKEITDMFSLEYNYNDELEAYRYAGMQQGMQQGIKQASMEMAYAMKKRGFEIGVIMEMTHLTKEEIGRL